MSFMQGSKFILDINKDEEKIAQLLTRDAWGYFGSMISSRDLFHVKDIPMMPRRGVLSIAPDEELIQYYLDYASAYINELVGMGWETDRASTAAESFARKLEEVSGQLRGRGLCSTERMVG